MILTPTQTIILNEQDETGTGTAAMVAGYQNVMLQVIATDPTGITIKVQGSLSNVNGDAPDFSMTPSAINPWDYVAVFDYQNPTSVIAGDTGLTFSSDDVKNLLVNVDGLTWLNVTVTGYTDGDITVKMIAFTNG